MEKKLSPYHAAGPVETYARKERDGVVRVFVRIRMVGGGRVNMSFPINLAGKIAVAFARAFRDARQLTDAQSKTSANGAAAGGAE